MAAALFLSAFTNNWRGQALEKVKVAWSDIEMKWFGGNPQAFIQMAELFFNFGSIKQDARPSPGRHLIK